MKTVKSISKRLAIDASRVLLYIKADLLPAEKAGRRYLITDYDAGQFVMRYQKEGPFLPIDKKKRIERQAVRNPDCAQYDTCLEQAAKNNKLFHCPACSNFERAGERIIDRSEIDRIYNLWFAVGLAEQK